jgi:hypothetical protein
MIPPGDQLLVPSTTRKSNENEGDHYYRRGYLDFDIYDKVHDNQTLNYFFLYLLSDK